MAKSKGLQTVPAPGTRVRLTGYFLKATGQQRGGDGASKWKIVACDCGLCQPRRGQSQEFVAVDEKPYDFDQWDAAEKAERSPWRHFAMANLEIVGKVPHSRDMSDAPELVAGKKSPAQIQAEVDRIIAERERSD